MDFTYFIAAFIALVVGFLASLVVVLIGGRSKAGLLVSAFLAALVTNGIVLINWAALGEMSVGFLLLDFIFIAIYSLAGSMMGVILQCGFAIGKIRLSKIITGGLR